MISFVIGYFASKIIGCNILLGNLELGRRSLTGADPERQKRWYNKNSERSMPGNFANNY